jgi:hypothetical protein
MHDEFTKNSNLKAHKAQERVMTVTKKQVEFTSRIFKNIFI